MKDRNEYYTPSQENILLETINKISIHGSKKTREIDKETRKGAELLLKAVNSLIEMGDMGEIGLTPINVGPYVLSKHFELGISFTLKVGHLLDPSGKPEIHISYYKKTNLVRAVSITESKDFQQV